MGAAEILDVGWRTGGSGAVEVLIYVRRLRRKMGSTALPFRLLSERGKGYCLNSAA